MILSTLARMIQKRTSPARSLGFLFLTLVLGSCVATKNSHVIQGEDVSMKIDEQKDILVLARLDNQSQGSSRGLMEDIVGKGISLAADGVKKLIDLDKKKYTAEYKDGANELYFYNNISVRGPLDPEGIVFNGLTLMRSVEKNKQVTSDTAVYAFFELDKDDPFQMINNSIFRLRLKELKVNYAKAKIPDVKWYLPWTWFNKKEQTINIDVEIKINATWYSDNGTFYQNIPIGLFNLNVRNLPMDREAQQKFLNDPKKGIIGKRIQGYSLLVPRSASFIKTNNNELTSSYGQGLYNIEVNVKEASKQTFVVKSVYDNSDQLVDQLMKLKK